MAVILLSWLGYGLRPASSALISVRTARLGVVSPSVPDVCSRKAVLSVDQNSKLELCSMQVCVVGPVHGLLRAGVFCEGGPWFVPEQVLWGSHHCKLVAAQLATKLGLTSTCSTFPPPWRYSDPSIVKMI